MNDSELIQFAWKHGHFFNPQYPACHGIRAEDLPTLTLADKEVIDAMKSVQASDSNIIPFAWLYHQRAMVVDGDVGPATQALAMMPRCPIPDFAPPPGATFDTGIPELNRVIESMQARATGRGSWPAGCYGHSDVHEVKISYEPSGASSKQKEWLPEIKKRSHAAVAAVGVRLIEVPVGQANIAVSFRPLGGSVIGLAEFNSGTCGDSVFCYLNPNYSPNLDQVLVLLLHENGHNWNLDHRAGNIMNPSILNTKPAWIERNGTQVTYQDNSFPTLRTYFGGEPLDPPEPPGPPVAKDVIRLSAPVAAGEHNGFTFGSAMAKGDYMMLLTDSTPPPTVP